ncbi:MAG: 16S rRNA (cytidine(1402)-2'-O)-methyltransferase [Gammaproteobacteria bacterium]|nr:16S rRNA (cytidine(1402)-2'-O)-methyltransferase [Gammaproteobacteria bacterium]
MKQASLYIVATPIGNRMDISQRAIEVLSEVDVIAAEDTRHSGQLLQYYNISRPMLAYHDHNESYQTEHILQRLKEGNSVALISDAGTPLMSDPGYRLVKAAQQAGIPVSPVPGPCAAIAALSASGLATDQFYFVGFPPAKSTARKTFFQGLMHHTATLVFYESSHRIVGSIRDMLEVFGDLRMAVVARELTKKFETIRQSNLSDLLQWVESDSNQQKGEFVLLLEGSLPTEATEELNLELDNMLKILMGELPVKQASQLTARITGLKKNHVYKRALALKGGE